jgi:hypothetical protein
MRFIPSEFAIGDVCLPPLLVAAALGIFAATLTAQQLNRRRLSDRFFYPPLVFVAMAVIYTVVIATFIVPA